VHAKQDVLLLKSVGHGHHGLCFIARLPSQERLRLIEATEAPRWAAVPDAKPAWGSRPGRRAAVWSEAMLAAQGR